jgi:hypothetical protein
MGVPREGEMDEKASTGGRVTAPGVGAEKVGRLVSTISVGT